MFKQKLKALDYMYWDKVNANEVTSDTEHFRKLVSWLEDQKIRHYTIEDRAGLREIGSSNWDKSFDKFIQDVGCPVTSSNLDKLEWLIGLAVRLEYEDNLNKYQKVTKEKSAHDAVPSVKSTNPLDNLDFESNEFKNRVSSLAKLLKIPQHPDHRVTLQACSKHVVQRLNPNALKNPSSVVIKGKPFPIMETDMGFDMGDKVLNNTAKALSLLYIQDLRNLQTGINEAIVAVQNITADPKTDTRAGKVGR
ncbi:RNA transcription, translation and transport factor protein isoform X1 [Microplitis mediator]|uniref:RNA transcription, translation and transport factor protein isoform X1 n=1 Tax=Microplitis mediator TaxID=375433 RepID=UPI00255299C4|nr:RNA transcription, translation and transport factor protein isoform X1 [Microplitis mediator]